MSTMVTKASNAAASWCPLSRCCAAATRRCSRWHVCCPHFQMRAPLFHKQLLSGQQAPVACKPFESSGPWSNMHCLGPAPLRERADAAAAVCCLLLLLIEGFP